MATYCTLCKTEFANDLEYCDVCGSKTEPQKNVAVEPPSFEVTPRSAVSTASKESKPAVSKPQAESTDQTVGTGAYFGLMFLFGIPLIGFIACLLMSFIPKNKNIKNYARAHLIWSIISLLIVLLLAIVVSTLVSAAISYVDDLFAIPLLELFEQLGGWDLFEQLMQMEDLGDLVNLLGNIDLSQLKLSELKPLLEQLGVGELAQLQPLMEQLDVTTLNDLQPLLEQLNVNDLSELSTVIGQLEANDLSELSTALNQLEIDSVGELGALIESQGINDINELMELAA